MNASPHFDFRAKDGNLGECQLERSAIVTVAGGMVKPVWSIDATRTKSVSKTSPKLLPRSNDGRNDRPPRSRSEHRLRRYGTVHIKPRCGNRFGCCSPVPPSPMALQADWSDVRKLSPISGLIRSTTVLLLTRSPRLNRAIQPAALADGTASHGQRRERHSGERGRKEGRQRQSRAPTTPLWEPYAGNLTPYGLRRPRPTYAFPPRVDFLSQPLNPHEHQTHPKSGKTST
jgi:hypothetical protein